MMMLTDVHTHLERDPASSLARAQNAGVGIVLAAATDVATAERNVFLAEKYSRVKACIGIHPWRADLYTPETEKALGALIQKGGVTAISETGIDLIRRLAEDFHTELQPLPLDVQIKAFRAQVRLCVDNGLFLVLHDRGATQEIIRVLDEFKDPAPRGIVHGFSGTVDEAREYLQKGFLISINKRNLPAINPVLAALTLDQMVLETDSSEPAQVVEVCAAVARFKNKTGEEVAQATTANLKRLLKQ